MTEMGLAVLQQTKQFGHGFEHGMLARAFDDAHNAFKETLKPLLRLVDVDRIEENLDDLKTKLSAIPNFLDLDNNVEDHDVHVEKTVFNYGTKEVNATPSTHIDDHTNDRDITTAIGYIKGQHANQAGLAARKANADAKTSFMLIAQQQMQQRAQEIAQQIERLQRQIREIQEYQSRTAHLKSEDFDANTAEGRKNREELNRILKASGSDKTADDFTKKDGTFDIDAKDRHLDDLKQAKTMDMTTLIKAEAEANLETAHNNRSPNALTEETTNNLNNTSYGFASLDSLFNGSADFAQTEYVSTLDAPENYVEIAQVTASQQGFGERSYSSAAAEMDGKENCSVISMAFTQCAAGTAPQQVAAAPQPQRDLQQNQNASYSAVKLG